MKKLNFDPKLYTEIKAAISSSKILLFDQKSSPLKECFENYIIAQKMLIDDLKTLHAEIKEQALEIENLRNMKLMLQVQNNLRYGKFGTIAKKVIYCDKCGRTTPAREHPQFCSACVPY